MRSVMYIYVRFIKPFSPLVFVHYTDNSLFANKKHSFVWGVLSDLDWQEKTFKSIKHNLIHLRII